MMAKKKKKAAKKSTKKITGRPAKARTFKYEAPIRERVDHVLPQLEEALRKVVARKPPDKARILWFIATGGGNRYGIPVLYCYMDARAISADQPARPILKKSNFEYVGYDDIRKLGYEGAERILLKIVGEAFRAAGGADYPLACYATRHDSGRALNLKTQKWVEVKDINEE